jgi:hypothetical protein
MQKFVNNIGTLMLICNVKAQTTNVSQDDALQNITQTTATSCTNYERTMQLTNLYNFNR